MTLFSPIYSHDLCTYPEPVTLIFIKIYKYIVEENVFY